MNEQELWDEHQNERLFERIMRPSKCVICGEPYLSVDDYGMGDKCPSGHTQFFNDITKCSYCASFEHDRNEYGECMSCDRYMDNLKGWPFMRGCKKFIPAKDDERFLKSVEHMDGTIRLLDLFRNIRKNNNERIVMTSEDS